MNTVTRTMTAFLAVGTLLMVSACGGSGNVDAVSEELDGPQAEWYQAAQEEPPMKFYSMHDPNLIDAAAQRFQEKYPGLSVETLRLTSGQLSTRYAQEKGNNARTADVFTIGDEGLLADAAEKDWILDLDELDIPTLQDLDDQWLSENAVITGVLPLGIAYNTELIPEPPTDWEIALDEEYRDQIVFPDFRNAPIYLDQGKLWIDEFGEGYLEDLHAQNPTMVDSMVPGAQLVANGQAKLMVPGVVSNVRDLADSGAPIDVAFPDEVVGTQLYTALSADSPSENTAKLFLDFLMSEEGQQAYISDQAVSAIGSEGSMPLPEGFRINDPDHMEETLQTMQDAFVL